MRPINSSPSSLVNQKVTDDILVTGIKVTDLLAPYLKGGKISLFGGTAVKHQDEETLLHLLR